MPKYTVLSVRYSTVYETVEAATPREAADKAELHASLCHQCAEDVELGEHDFCRVIDEAGEEVYTDETPARTIADFTDDELREEVKRRALAAKPRKRR